MKCAVQLLSRVKKSVQKGNPRTAVLRGSDSFQDPTQKHFPSQNSPWILHLPKLIAVALSAGVFTINIVPYLSLTTITLTTKPLQPLRLTVAHLPLD